MVIVTSPVVAGDTLHGVGTGFYSIIFLIYSIPVVILSCPPFTSLRCQPPIIGKKGPPKANTLKSRWRTNESN